MKLVSACLLGIKCSWNGTDEYKNDKIIELLKNEVLVPMLNRKSKVKNKAGEDITLKFIRGAKEALKIARQYNIKEFIGKSRSPSCGCGLIYDGSFSEKLIKLKFQRTYP